MNIKTPKDVGHYIASTRKALKLSQTDFAKKIGKDQRFVSKLENDPASVSFGTVLMVLNVLNIKIDMFNSVATTNQDPDKLAAPRVKAGGLESLRWTRKPTGRPLKIGISGKLFSPSDKKPVIVSKQKIEKK